ncbi:hypothetical protein MPSEU_000049000 [Mayamaea pseudoterrestris]|nr:hypothetical protein MPSEU_000049000 [Mayamaea pseudoterrestris]
MKQASLRFLLLLLPWHVSVRAHTPFRRSSLTADIHSSTSASKELDNLLDGPADAASPVLSRGGSIRTASFAADDERLGLKVSSQAKETKVNESLAPGNAAAAVTEASISSRMRGGDSSKDSIDNTSKSLYPKKKLHLPWRKEKRHDQIAKQLKNRNNVNIRRKLMHATFGLTFAFLNHVIPRNRFVPGMALLSTATLIMELLRYRKGFGWMNEALHFCLGSSLRKNEMAGGFTGSFYFFTGVTLTAYLFPGTPATLGMAQLALADPSASYFGRRTRHVYWSRIENGLGGVGRNKGWLGFLGGALFCFPFNYYVLSKAAQRCATRVISVNAVVGVSLLLGLAGALADLAVPTPALTLPKKVLGVPVPPFHVDDNMVVPIFSAFACTKVFQFYEWPLDLALAKWIVL